MNIRTMSALAALVAVIACAAHAQSPSGFPNKPVHLVVPFAPGGPIDVVARLIAPKLESASVSR